MTVTDAKAVLAGRPSAQVWEGVTLPAHTIVYAPASLAAVPPADARKARQVADECSAFLRLGATRGIRWYRELEPGAQVPTGSHPSDKRLAGWMTGTFTRGPWAEPPRYILFKRPLPPT